MGKSKSAKKNMRRKARKTNATSLPQVRVATTTKLPITPYSMVTNLAPTMTFGSANFQGQKGLRVTGRQMYCTVGLWNVGTLTYSQYSLNTYVDGQNNWGTALAFDPGNPRKLIQPLSDITNGFLKYRVRNLVFDYVPTVSTNTSGNVVLGWIQDTPTAMGGTTGSYVDSLLAWNDIQGAASLECSVMTPPYVPARIDCSGQVDCDHLYYTSNAASSANTLDRFSLSGTLVAACQSPQFTIGNQTSNMQLGYVLVSYDIELYHTYRDVQTAAYGVVREPPPICEESSSSTCVAAQVTPVDSDQATLEKSGGPRVSVSGHSTPIGVAPVFSQGQTFVARR